MSADDLIADVLLRGADPSEASRKMNCNMVASQAMFCQICSRCLDEKTVVAITVKTPARRVVFGYCPTCWESRQSETMVAAKETQTPIRVETWFCEIFSQGEVD